jgi:hypothetical protein
MDKPKEIAYDKIMQAATLLDIEPKGLCKALEAIGFTHLVDKAGMHYVRKNEVA